MKRREFLAGVVALAGCTGSPSPPNIAEPIPPVPTPEPMANNNLVASDNFVSGSLAAGWSVYFNAAQTGTVVVGSPNTVQPGVISSTCAQVWTGTAFPKDQTSEVTLNALTSSTNYTLTLIVRADQVHQNGYQANISNGNATIFRFTANTPTQLATVAGLTFAATDVWAFTAAGPCLTVYQNTKIVLFWADTTYISGGAPGFGEFYSLAPASNVQVASWRGYNCVTQDGIWQKQGTANIPIVSTDINTGTSFVNSGIDTSSIILYEGNAQILSGTVYKMWIGTASGIQYVESLDAINWSRFGSTVLAGFSFPAILKVAGTYYMYVQSNTVTAGTGSINVYTSSNGTTWTLQNASVIALGTAGQWDAAAIYLFTPVYVDGGGTWHAVYSGGNGTTFALGLATSPDGINWTKYVSNPVASRIWASIPYLIGGTWYMWAQGVPPGQQAASANPAQGVRIQSTDLINWTNRVISIRNNELYEGVNYVWGFAYPSALITVGGSTYMYYLGGPSNTVSNTGSSWNLSLAIASAPMSQIIKFQEDGVQQTATDTFQRANGTLGPNWLATGANAAQIASNLVEPSAISAHCMMAYTARGSSAAPQYSEVTLATASASQSQVTPCIYLQPGSQSGYACVFGGVVGTLTANGGVQIFIVTNGTFTGLGTWLSTVAYTAQVGDVYRLIGFRGADGSIVLRAYQNGWLVAQAQDYAATYKSGYPGFDILNTTAIIDTQISAWAGGNANVSPFAGAGGGDLGPGYDFFYRF